MNTRISAAWHGPWKRLRTQRGAQRGAQRTTRKIKRICPICLGTGWKGKCVTCNGTGYIEDEIEVVR